MPNRSSSKEVNMVSSAKFNEKDWGMSLEALRRSLEAASDDLMWFYDNLASLRKRYLNRWVAVKDKRIVMSDLDHERLLLRLSKQKMEPPRPRVFFVEPEEVIHVY